MNFFLFTVAVLFSVSTSLYSLPSMSCVSSPYSISTSTNFIQYHVHRPTLLASSIKLPVFCPIFLTTLIFYSIIWDYIYVFLSCADFLLFHCHLSDCHHSPQRYFLPLNPWLLFSHHHSLLLHLYLLQLIRFQLFVPVPSPFSATYSIVHHPPVLELGI